MPVYLLSVVSCIFPVDFLSHPIMPMRHTAEQQRRNASHVCPGPTSEWTTTFDGRPSQSDARCSSEVLGVESGQLDEVTIGHPPTLRAKHDAGDCTALGQSWLCTGMTFRHCIAV